MNKNLQRVAEMVEFFENLGFDGTEVNIIVTEILLAEDRGAAVAFGLMGMAFALRRHDRRARRIV